MTIKCLLLFTTLLFATSASGKETNESDWSASCPEPLSLAKFSLSSMPVLKNHEDLKGVVAAITRVQPRKYSADLLTLDPMNVSYAPVAVRPNRVCDGIIAFFHLTIAAEFDEKKLAALARLSNWPSGLDPTIAEVVCAQPRLNWMRDFGYTHRHLLLTPENILVNDFTYDYAQCSKYIGVMNGK